MATQTYTALFPVQVDGATVAQGGTFTRDDADPGTLQMLATGTIILQSAPGRAAKLAADQALTTAQQTGPGGEQVQASENTDYDPNLTNPGL